MRFYPTTPIRVHCWGGLGSQLFAYNLQLDIAKRFPRRKSVLIIHSSGVTFRQPEIQFLLNKNDFRFHDDFGSKSVGASDGDRISHTSLLRNLTKRSLRQLLVFLGFIGLCNNDVDFEKMKPWVVSIRGHYTHRKVSYSNLEIIERRAEEAGVDSPRKPNQNKIIGVHYRLGDLLTINTKSPVSPNRIRQRIQGVIQQYPNFKVEVYSDVSSTAESLLGSFEKLEFLQADAWSTICRLSGNQFFVGTNSKISEWVVIFRSSKDPNSISFLPADFRLEVLKAISNPQECVNLLEL
jgi:hypothetical protein